MYEHNALGYWSGLALCLTKVRSSRARCPATALILVRSLKIHYIDILHGPSGTKCIDVQGKMDIIPLPLGHLTLAQK